jgi:hypothetical protein
LVVLIKHHGVELCTEAGHDIVLRHLIIIRLKRRRDRHYSLPIRQEGYLYVGAGSLPFIL